MPTLLHEALIELFRTRPVLAPELLRDVFGLDLPSFAEVRIGESDLSTLAPTSFLSDLVVLLRRGDAVLGIVVEVQLAIDVDKPASWLVYVANLHARLRAPVMLLVLCPDERVATWCARPTSYGHPGLELRPLVLGPKNVPVVVDEDVGRETPELALLSALVHAKGPHALDVAKVALRAALRLDDDRAQIYADLILSKSLHRAELEGLVMDISKYEFQSEFFKRLIQQKVDEGMQQGIEQAQVRAKVQSLFVILEARSLQPSEDVVASIHACNDVALLDAWIARAAVADTVDEIFD